MKKVFALLLLAGLAFVPVASFATSADEGLGQGAGFNGSLATGSADLIQLFPNEAANFGAWATWRFGVPDQGTANKSGWGSLISGQDNWFGISDNKHGLGTWTVYSNRPSNYFTHNAGGVPNLDPSYHNAGNGYGTITNSWDDVLQQWGPDYRPNETNRGNGNRGGYSGWYSWVVGTPQEKFSINFSDKVGDDTLGIEVNYGDTAGNNNWNLTGTTQTDTNPTSLAAGTWDGYKRYWDESSQLGLNVGFGTKVSDMNLDLAVGYEMGNLDYMDSELEQNATNSGTNNYYIATLKPANGGIYDINVSALLTKDQDENTQMRLALTGTLGNLGAEEIGQNDNNNDGDFTTAGDTNIKLEDSYANTMANLMAGCVHKIEGGKGRLVANLGVAYRDQHFKNQYFTWNSGAARFDTSWKTDGDYNSITVPLAVGAEQDLNDWLTVRMGAHTNLLDLQGATEIGYSGLNAGQYTGSETDTFYSQPFDNVTFTSGFSTKIGNFTFDALLNENFFENTFMTAVQPGRGTFFTGNLVTVAKVDGTFRY